MIGAPFPHIGGPKDFQRATMQHHARPLGQPGTSKGHLGPRHGAVFDGTRHASLDHRHIPPKPEAPAWTVTWPPEQPSSVSLADGSRLSELGLPTPNLFTGGHDYHSKREWICVQDMGTACAMLVHLAQVWTE